MRLLPDTQRLHDNGPGAVWFVDSDLHTSCKPPITHAGGKWEVKKEVKGCSQSKLASLEDVEG